MMQLETPFGLMTAAFDDQGALTEFIFATPERMAAASQAESPAGAALRRQLDEFFAGERREFDIPLAPRGTGFQKSVWAELVKIPFGETISYGELARRLGNPSASRAVGRANATNPIALIVPCHRVIGANGTLTGYAGGIERKEQMLAWEQSVAGVGLFASALR